MLPSDREARFWAKVAIPRDVVSGCWLWRGARARGYGHFCVDKRRVRGAHRVSYETLRGPIPEGMQIDHLCRVRNCINPAHLEVVTQAENTARAWAGPDAIRGTANVSAKLDDAKVVEIRALAGTVTDVELARRFGVSKRLIALVRRHEAWRHVP